VSCPPEALVRRSQERPTTAAYFLPLGLMVSTTCVEGRDVAFFTVVNCPVFAERPIFGIVFPPPSLC